MPNNNFQTGYLSYIVAGQIPKQVCLNNWENGYAAFSRGELLWRELPAKSYRDLFQDRIAISGKVEGYLLELDVWKNDGDDCHEMCIQRHNEQFLYQYWHFSPQRPANQAVVACYYRDVDTLPRKSSKFKSLLAKEIICPDVRLHFFLTVKGA